MAHLFRDFSFEAASRHCDADRAAMNVSPTSMLHHPSPRDLSMGTSTPPPPCSIGELAARFDQQSLQVEVDPAYAFTSPKDDSLVSPTNITFPAHILEPAPRSRYSRVSSAALRMQRQSNARMLQSSPAHLKEISNLVQKMVQDGDQCRVHSFNSRTSSASSSSDEDEGIDMDYTPLSTPLYTPSYRRAADRMSGCAVVPNSIRMRKRSPISKRPSK
ncbi:hypothetical protein B0J11DRAFT_585421 [Dendryphion nanum]|uniref:Uncharacterized protein n=1 Tax=Dendryphion nanum TaxID=256645 RepID=A0A9P9D4V7_9PLEO|nr:hypothetical protein B0J11DRAFT_585421 [Dendryphion nanum]